jgi:hypothetical protein
VRSKFKWDREESKRRGYLDRASATVKRRPKMDREATKAG